MTSEARPFGKAAKTFSDMNVWVSPKAAKWKQNKTVEPNQKTYSFGRENRKQEKDECEKIFANIPLVKIPKQLTTQQQWNNPANGQRFTLNEHLSRDAQMASV